MKVNIEIDCTPLEARQFFGLPDLQPMQTAVMDKLQHQMIANIDKVSPESLIQSWFSFDPKLAERMQAEGVYVVAFSFPVVPHGKARIRTQLSAAHSTAQLDRVIDAFGRAGRALGIIQ